MKIAPSRFLAVSLVLCSFGCSEPVHRVEPIHEMGRDGFIELYMSSDERFDEAIADAREQIRNVAAALDHRQPDSGLAQLNLGAQEAYHAVEDVDVYRAMVLALDYARVRSST